MAVIALTQQVTNRTGLADPAGQAVAAADTAEFDNDGEVILRVVWGGTGGNLIVETAASLGSNPAHAVADDTISFSASQVKWLGPYPPGIYNNTSNKVVIDPNQACTVTAFKLGSLD